MLDQVKTGKFIAEARKNQNLTQKELAEKLGVTDKAISKWETGRSMPDNSILIELCQVLKISVNELLSGERLSSDSYSGKAEENMMDLMKATAEQRSKQRYTTIGTVIGFLALVVALLLLMLSSTQGNISWFIDFPSMLGIVGITLLVLAASGMTRDFFGAFSVCYGKAADVSKEKIERALNAFRVVIVTLLVSGGFMFVVNLAAILGTLTSFEYLGPMVYVALMALFYSFLFVLLLTPTAARLRVKAFEAC